jgi:hypothetical protein
MRIWIATLLGLVACSSEARPPIPPLADHLPPDVREGKKAFDQRVKASFPVGSRESDAIAALARQGFKVTAPSTGGLRSADFEKNGGICETIWSVRWHAKDDTISEIFGVYGLRCP